MKMILTDADGMAAAKKACAMTTEVTEITVKEREASIFVLKVPPNADYMTVSKSFHDKLSDILEKITSDGASERVAFVVMPADQSLEHIPQAAMLKFGWKRVR